jgi:spermidine synthase
MRSRTWSVGSLLCGSGFCALVYQIGWLREFRLIFGASTAASAAVLAIFIGGLGIGSLLLGPRADRHPRPLLLYSNLEATIAICAAASPLLLMLVRSAYLATGGSARLGMPVATAFRLVLSALVLAAPTIAMGGTLPAAARAVTRATDTRRQDVAALYALNTIGAVAGCMIATFWMLEMFGTRRTLWLAAAMNLIVATIARQVDRTWAEQAGAAGEAGSGEEAPAVRATPALPADAIPDLPDLPLFALIASATVGFAFFLLELIWYRLLGPLLGGSVFTFGLVLAVALTGIGLGGLAYSMFAGDRRASLTGFAVSSLVEAAAVAATYALGDRVATLALVLLSLQSAGFAAHVAGWTIVTAIVVLPPALVAGYQFPLLIALFGHGRDRVGSHVGFAYAANTAGAIVGSLAGGFGILPWLSAPLAWKLVAVVLLVLGVAAAVLAAARRTARASSLSLTVAAAAVTTVLLFATGPTAVWRHAGIGAGRAPAFVLNTPNDLRSWQQANRRKIEWEADGVESSVALALEPTGHAFLVNGKSDGSARADAGTQVMLGLLALLGQPASQRALVIGLGTGSTAGWLAAVPSMQRVDTVELEPIIVNVARECAAVNRDALANPKLRVVIGDAREFLLTTGDRYDVIASEPSNPFRAGVASLFTEEYYRAASDRLTPNGVFAQWVQAYEIDSRTLRTVYATLSAVFPYVETWQTSPGDLVLVGARRPIAYDSRALAARLEDEPVRSAIANTWRAVNVDGLFAHFVANDRFAQTLARMPGVDVNTDDRNVVEFGLARSVGRSHGTLVAEVRRDARAISAARPRLAADEGVNWGAVDTAWVNFNGWDEDSRAAAGTATADEQSRRVALQRYSIGDLKGAREYWGRQTDPPRDLFDLEMLADLEADAQSDAAWALIDRLRAYQPAEADVLTSELLFRQQEYDRAVTAVESALVRFRSDPWPLLSFKERALQLANAIASKQPASGRRLLAAMSQPFALNALSDQRRMAMLDMARQIDYASLCRTPVSELEPHMIWSETALRARYTCYTSTHDPRQAIALRELDDFVSREPQSLVPR